MPDKLKYNIIIDYEEAHAAENVEMEGVEIAGGFRVSASLVRRGQNGNLLNETYNYSFGRDITSIEDIIAELNRQAHQAKQIYDESGEKRLRAIIEQIRNNDLGENVLG